VHASRPESAAAPDVRSPERLRRKPPLHAAGVQSDALSEDTSNGHQAYEAGYPSNFVKSEPVSGPQIMEKPEQLDARHQPKRTSNAPRHVAPSAQPREAADRRWKRDEMRLRGHQEELDVTR